MSRWHTLKTALVIALLCGMMLSPRLWLSGRSYPLVPVWDGLPAIPGTLSWMIFGVLIAALGAIVVAPRPRLAMLVFVLLAGAWSLWDQTRWQPWFYQYLVMFAVLALGPAPDDPERGPVSLSACRIIVAGTYVWSGLQKVNVLFADDVYPWLMEPVVAHLPKEWHALVLGRGWEAAYLECGIGLGLLIWPLRTVAMLAAVSMHLLILFSLGPWGHNWNTVVWPWNVAMIVFVIVLFGGTRRVMPWHIVWPRRNLAARVALLLFGVMPLFNFFEWWDSYLSAALYSGNTPEVRIHVSMEVCNRLPPEVAASHVRWREDASLEDPCPYEVDLFYWAITELNVPGYPAERVWCGIARRLAELPERFPAEAPDPMLSEDVRPGVRVILVVKGRANWRTGERWEKRIEFPQ